MRKAFENFNGTRKLYRGVFKRMGRRQDIKGDWINTIMFQIEDEKGRLLCDHLWFDHIKGFRKLGRFNVGDKIEFFARVDEYLKGYKDEYNDLRKKEYRLVYPTKIKRIS